MSIVIFSPTYFNIGAMYTVSSRYEHTFIGKCIECDGENVVFETSYGKLSITPTMAVTQDYRFERLPIKDATSEESQEIVNKFANDADTFIDRFNKHICESLKDPSLDSLMEYHGTVAGSPGELSSIQLHKCEVPLFNKEDIPVINVSASNSNMKEFLQKIGEDVE